MVRRGFEKLSQIRHEQARARIGRRGDTPNSIVMIGIRLSPNVDETFTKLLDPDRRGRSHDAYLWGYYAPHEKAFVLEFSPSRRGSRGANRPSDDG